jgi:2-hydroxychromene-2-carboxylate isomerase
MGEVIRLDQRRRARRGRPERGRRLLRAEFLFDLACPFTYLAAERVDRAFDELLWTPASTTALRAGSLDTDATALERVQLAAGERATALRLPLVWPERFPANVPSAMRVAAYAAECGRGAAFVLAAGRLAFCGGFDLEDPDILAEAAAAAGLSLDDAVAAAGDIRRDEAAKSAARRLRAAGADRLPALRVGRALYWGEGQVGGAIAAARVGTAAAGR